MQVSHHLRSQEVAKSMSFNLNQNPLSMYMIGGRQFLSLIDPVLILSQFMEYFMLCFHVSINLYSNYDEFDLLVERKFISMQFCQFSLIPIEKNEFFKEFLLEL